MNSKTNREALAVRTFELSELGSVHGVTCDDKGRVWFAHDDGNLVCLEPSSGRVVRSFEGIGATSGTAFDGSHIWQITEAEIQRIDPETGAVERSLAKPEGAHCSGMAYADGKLWIGDYDGKRVLAIDASTGEVVKELTTDRLVTGIEWVEGELWHGAWERRERPVGASLRRIDAESGAVTEELAMPDDWSVSGTGVDAEGRIWCGGSRDGGLRAVRKP